MAFMPINIFGAVFLLFLIIWGWEGETLRRLLAVVTSTFLISMWNLPLYSIADDSVCCTIVKTPGWLPTLLFQIFTWSSIAVFFACYAHIVEGDDRDLALRKNRTLLGRKR